MSDFTQFLEKEKPVSANQMDYSNILPKPVLVKLCGHKGGLEIFKRSILPNGCKIERHQQIHNFFMNKISHGDN